VWHRDDIAAQVPAFYYVERRPFLVLVVPNLRPRRNNPLRFVAAADGRNRHFCRICVTHVLFSPCKARFGRPITIHQTCVHDNVRLDYDLYNILMKFSEFSKYLQQTDQTAKRLEITSVLADLVKNLTEREMDKAIFLSLGELAAPFAQKKFNMADKMVIRAMEIAYGKTREKIQKAYNKEGDLGSVAEAFKLTKKGEELSITEVYGKLEEIAGDEGSGSQERKTARLAKLLTQLDSLCAKYVIRIVLGNTRLGFTTLTVIDALSQYLAGDKSLSEKIEEKYNAHPDIGLIAKKVKENGFAGIKDVDVEIGVPIMPQKAQRVGGTEEAMERMKQAWAEYKFDGTRVQLHMDRNRLLEKRDQQETLLETARPKFFIKTYTRNLDDNTHQFPEIVDAANKQIVADSVILDGEAIGYDQKTGEFLPFQETIQRKRKHEVADFAKQIPLKFIVFDVVYHNGRSLINESLIKRRELLKEIVKEGEVIKVDDHLLTEDEKELFEFLKKAKERGFEGIMVKTPHAAYQAGARSYAWIKIKRLDEKNLADSFDCVILGYYYGKGLRAEFGIGGFLVGVYDKSSDTYKTVTKIGTGLKEDEWVKLKKEANKIKISKQPKNVEVAQALVPDVWVEPKKVVTIRADEITKSSQHTAGYALRFPRLMQFRDDKNPQDTTSVEEIKRLYELK